MHFDRPKNRFDIKRFARCESGAVTVDWVVLTAATVGLALGLFSVITEGHFQDAALAINEDIEEAARR